MRFIKYIVIHCSAGYGNVASIKRFWKEVLGWKEVGYHFFIYQDGTIERLLNISKISNGVKGYNSSSVHISYQGGVDPKNVNQAVDTRTDAQKLAIIEVIKEVLEELKKTQDASDIKILGHRDFSPDKNGNGVIESWERIKECPSFNAIPEYAWLLGVKAFSSKTLLSLLLPFLMVFFLSCGTKKKVTEQSSSFNLSQIETTALNGIINEETLVYGGFLQGAIPIGVLSNDGDSVVIESENSSLKLKNQNGQLHYDATAKPKQATNTTSNLNFQNQKSANVSGDDNSSKSNTRTGFQAPLWLWIVSGCILAVGLFILYKKSINLIKNFLK